MSHTEYQNQMDYDATLKKQEEEEKIVSCYCCAPCCRNEIKTTKKMMASLGVFQGLYCNNCWDEFNLMKKLDEKLDIWGGKWYWEWRPIDAKPDSYKEGVYTYYKYDKHYELTKDCEYGEEMKKYRLEITKQTPCFVHFTIQEIDSPNGNYGVRPLDDKIYTYRKKKIAYSKVRENIRGHPHSSDEFVEVPCFKPVGRNYKHYLDINHIHPWV